MMCVTGSTLVSYFPEEYIYYSLQNTTRFNMNPYFAKNLRATRHVDLPNEYIVTIHDNDNYFIYILEYH